MSPGARRDSSRAPAPVSPRARSNWPEQRERRHRFGVRLGLGVRHFHADDAAVGRAQVYTTVCQILTPEQQARAEEIRDGLGGSMSVEP